MEGCQQVGIGSIIDLACDIQGRVADTQVALTHRSATLR